MDKKTKRFKPSNILVLGSLIFLAFMGYYFFYWVPSQKAYLANRYLRVMAMMSDQFVERVKNFPKEIEITIDNQIPIEQNNNDPKNPITEGTKKYLKANLKSYFPNAVPDPNSPETQEPPKFYNPSLEAFIFPVKVKFINNKGQSEFRTLNIPVKVADFIRELSSGEEFEDVIIFDDQAAVICIRNQYMKKGIENSTRALTINEVLLKGQSWEPGDETDKNETKTGSDQSYTRLLDIKIAMSDYKFFLQPIPLQFFQSGAGTANVKHWQIAGVLSADTFSRRFREIPVNYLLLFIFLLSLAFIAYPMARLLLIGPWERIHIRDVCFLALSLAVGIPIIIFSILIVSHDQATKGNLENDFKQLANRIEDRFTNEIQCAYDQLSFLEKEKLYLLKHDTANEKNPGQNPLDSLIKNGITYPYFDMVFVVDHQGNQIYKGAADDSLNSLKNVSTRDYFRRILKKDYWYTSNNQPMVLDPVYSMSNALYELNLAIPSSGPEYAAAVISFRPLSVLNPLLPGDYGFAIIDRDGKVIFHKDRRLNSNENFYSECSDFKRIKAALFSEAQDFISPTLNQGKKKGYFCKTDGKYPVGDYCF